MAYATPKYHRVLPGDTISGMDITAIQTALRDVGFDGWLFYDHHHRDPLAYGILGLDLGAGNGSAAQIGASD